MKRDSGATETVKPVIRNPRTRRDHGAFIRTGAIATTTVLLISGGITVHRVGAIFTDSDIPSDEAQMWFVSALHGSPLARIVKEIPLASSQAEAWALAIQYLAPQGSTDEELSCEAPPVRRTARKMWRDIREHASYGLYCEIHAAQHYGEKLSMSARLMAWLGGAATGLCNDGSWMPISWRLMGRAPRDWNDHVAAMSATDKLADQ
ncbi:hypothetical protein BLA39750_01231 [Burkholderia lata]|uniref:Uncharacterized protein n=1 Tax=Burkholderia lata (strain ATCC 17760 / DSM 23089 / LMG 22485 / NCIMB 9086 / R18194 / 383) TaxID=482957 RepID=A0A6P2VSG3_BURL3|nr:hypothetical protein BLA39750_01231 [Burkholderia lata]